MVGYSYTWEKSRGSQNFVAEKLDRALASTSWHNLFTNADVHNEEALWSDHSAICLQLGNPKAPYIPKFRFENAWLREGECRQVVVRSWGRHHGEFILCKIFACGEELQTWGRNQRILFKKKIRLCHNRIQWLKLQAGNSSATQILGARKELGVLLAQQEDYWKPRAKQLWLKGGDTNTIFSQLCLIQEKEKLCKCVEK